MAADWSELPKDILVEVLKRLPVASHRLRFRAVCTSWQWVELYSQHFAPAPLQVLGLMVPAGDPNSETRVFYSLAEKKTYNIINHLMHFPPSLKCLGVSPAGWFLTIDKNNFDTALCNPFSQIRIRLPPVSKLVDPRKPHDQLLLDHCPTVWGAASSGRDLDKNILMVMINLQEPDKLAFARPGDESWTLLVKRIGKSWHKEEGRMFDIIRFNEHYFYSIDHYGRLYRCDDIIGGTDPKITVVASFKFPYRETNPQNSYLWYYLVESLGCLFLVVKTMVLTKAETLEIERRNQLRRQNLKNVDVRYDFQCKEGDVSERSRRSDDWDIIDDENIPQRKVDYSSYTVEDHLGYRTINFEVFKVDMDAKKSVKVNDLEDRAFVLGWHSPFSIAAQNTDGFKPNCIYFLDDYYASQEYGGHDNGVFCLEDGSTTAIYFQPPKSQTPVPLWLTLIPS